MLPKFTFCITFSLISTLPISSNAAEWVYVGSGGGGDLSVWVDKDSMRRSGSKVKTWSRWTYKKPKLLSESGPARYFQGMQALEVYLCDERSGTHLQVIKYADTDFSDQVEARTYPDDAKRYEDVVPDSLGEKLLKFACKVTEPTRQ